MDFKELKKEIKETYGQEYLDKVLEESLSKTLWKGIKGGGLTSMAVLCLSAGTFITGALTSNPALLDIGGYAFLGTGAATVGILGPISITLNFIEQSVAKKNLNKDIKNGTLLERYQNEVVPQKKRALREEASVEVKAFNEKKEARKTEMNALDAIATLPTEDFKKAFNKKSIRARMNTVIAKMASVEPLKNNKPKAPQ